MAKIAKSVMGGLVLDPLECPFREFRDAELAIDFWGMGPNSFRTAMFTVKDKTEKAHLDKHTPPDVIIWEDQQVQPLPKTIRHDLHEWVRAEDLALNKYEADLVIVDDNDGGKMNTIDYLYNHTQVMRRSSFCRRVMSICYMLEKFEGIIVEHQWDGFLCNFGPEGWRPKFHIYSPGLKAGGGAQHKPVISKNGCYLVRLYYMGSWRCIWVNDQVPVDEFGSPLLPFAPVTPKVLPKPAGKQPASAAKPPAGKPPAGSGKQAAPPPAKIIYLWPVLLCKALLKLAVPDMTKDEPLPEEEDVMEIEDEYIEYFDIFHAITGAVSVTWRKLDEEDLWKLMLREIPNFTWDEDDELAAVSAKAKVVKKPTAKDTAIVKRPSMSSIFIKDTKELAPFVVPGVTPAFEINILIKMVRDIPIKKPLPEPEVPMWKTYRWVDWAKAHGLYDQYACPRTKFMKCAALLKMSYAPHMLDIQSTESITFAYKDDKPKKGKDGPTASQTNLKLMKDELREWIPYVSIFEFIKEISIIYFPSMLQFASAHSVAPLHPIKGSTNRSLDVQAPKTCPLYVQVDWPVEISLKVAFSVTHPRIFLNCGNPLEEYFDPSYVFVERFEWFEDADLPMAKAFLCTRGYDSVEFKFQPGRHFLRFWVYSRLNWHAMLITESNLFVNTRDQIMAAAARECAWSAKFLLNVGTTFVNWIQKRKSTTQFTNSDKEFYKSYHPDLPWEIDVVGYPRPWLHWMFRKAIQNLLAKRLAPNEYKLACIALRKLFNDPDFGFPEKPLPPPSLREMIAGDPCDCDMSEVEQTEIVEAIKGEGVAEEQKPLLDDETIALLLKRPVYPNMSQLCELATEEVPCGVLRIEREKAIQRHEAATVIQSHWRKAWVIRCLNGLAIFPPDVQKAVIDSIFGNLEGLQSLMNEFFLMFPGAKSAYSVSSALSGVYGLQQHSGIVTCTPKCKWIPFFQSVFNCHHPVKVTFDLLTTIPHSTFSIYNNDTGHPLEQVYNVPKTFDMCPNEYGYTVIGHGSLEKPLGIYSDINWQLTIFSSLDGVFHVCDNPDYNYCKELPLQVATKLHIDEMFLPNKRNILGGIQMAVIKRDCVSFRAAASSTEMDIVATLTTIDATGQTIEVDKCKGKGEIYWPFIMLEPPVPTTLSSSIPKRRSSSHANLFSSTSQASQFREKSDRSVKSAKAGKPLSARGKPSSTKIDMKAPRADTKIYTIEVVVPKGWPLTLGQWTRVEEIRNTFDVRPDGGQKKPPKAGSAKDKDGRKEAPPSPMDPQPGDAYIELEVSVTLGGGVVAKRDDEREQAFAEARRQWEAKEPGRNMRGAQIRKDFRDEYLVPPPVPVDMFSVPSLVEEAQVEYQEGMGEVTENADPLPTPVSESIMEEMIEVEEETLFLEMPEQMKDKFEPLYFVPLCTRELIGEPVLITYEKAVAAKMDRHARIEAALERMRELQYYNEIHIIGRQKRRGLLLEKLYVDAQLKAELIEAFDIRDEVAILAGLANEPKKAQKQQPGKKK